MRIPEIFETAITTIEKSPIFYCYSILLQLIDVRLSYMIMQVLDVSS